MSLVRVDDGEDARYRFAEIVSVWTGPRGWKLVEVSVIGYGVEVWFLDGDVLLHSGEFARGAAGDLLDPEAAEFGFQLVELFLQVVFVLAPELAGLDLGAGRL